MNKKITASAAAIMAALVFSSCGSSSDDQPVNSNDAPAETTSAQSTSVTAADNSGETVPTVNMPVAEPAEQTVQVNYLNEIMFAGDDILAGISGHGGISDSMILAENGVSAKSFDEHTYSTGDGSVTAAEWAGKNKPKYIYLSLGMNDLSYCNDYTYYLGIRSAVKSLIEASPDSIIAIMDISPVGRSSSWDADVCDGEAHYDASIYNDVITQVIDELGNDNIKHIDMEEIVGSDGWLNDEYDSGDGMHLNDSGYEKLCSYITANRYFNENMGDFENAQMPVAEPIETVPDETEAPESGYEEKEETSGSEEIDNDSEFGLDADNPDYTLRYPEMYSVRAPYTVSEGKICYLTFDDGPSPNTEEILDILKENNIKATFFIVGWCIDGREDILERIAEEGHTIGVHTYSHDYEEIYASAGAYLDDFNHAYRRIEKVTGQKPWLFRFPGGSKNSFNSETSDEIISEMTRRGFVFFDWTCATSDATVGSTYDSCMENFRDTMGGEHEVVLMHDSKDVTVEYLQDVIDYAKDEGYSFESLDSADEVHF